MSSYRSDRCSKDELKIFKHDVINWLDEYFPNWKNKFKLRAFTCYNGDVRLYNGDFMEVTTSKRTFRRTKPVVDDSGRVTGFNGTRGYHIMRIPNYVTINRDEFNEIKDVLLKGDTKDDEYFWWNDLLFSKL